MEKQPVQYRRKRITIPAPRKLDTSTYTYEELYDEYWGRIQMLFAHSGIDWHDAEDLAQESLFRVWKYWNRIQWDKVSGAIAVIVNNVRYDYLRGNFDKPDKEFYEDTIEFESHDEGITDPLRKLVIERAADAVNEFTEVLRDKDREIFLDFYTRDIDIEEMCEKYGMKRTHIYVQLHRIRDLLHECFDAYDIIPNGYWNYGHAGARDD
ncbi:MAG: RNA polymerase sigma factor [Bacteroidales bacterium]